MRPVAALFVATGGVYFGLPGVDPWDESRDARLYLGPDPVVAHPPCERWGRYWHGGPSARVRRVLGDDEGCFEAARDALWRWGGVLEHPEASHAFRRFNLGAPPRAGGWYRSSDGRGAIGCVEQGNYGHRARKATWLFVVGARALPALRWGSSGTRARLDHGYHSAAERAAAVVAGTHQLHRGGTRLTAAENLATPIEFRDVLLSLARSVSACRRGRR